ncbi:hypothetical protein EDE15_3925 [Edaphobacter aggregans]|uniref:Uncharacterized protein n=1 Tax=Edaphobacter aggregans TaxID=570835 RepID=A0A428MN57_9BACT|nr:hypothetical protein [Edaphobacter aggregans]RSL18358.1 hypothetical protein EDE15_3925 [Edaphobacter aggregans]
MLANLFDVVESGTSSLLRCCSAFFATVFDVDFDDSPVGWLAKLTSTNRPHLSLREPYHSPFVLWLDAVALGAERIETEVEFGQIAEWLVDLEAGSLRSQLSTVIYGYRSQFLGLFRSPNAKVAGWTPARATTQNPINIGYLDMYAAAVASLQNASVIQK